MIDQARHIPLQPLSWNPDEVALAVEDIVSDALTRFDAERFWPAHPRDEHVQDGHTCFYVGATGMIWALDRCLVMRETGYAARQGPCHEATAR